YLSRAGSTSGPTLHSRQARGTLASPDTVVSGDDLLRLGGYGYSGGEYREAARITLDSMGTVTGTAVPGLIRFHTADASGTLTQSMSIDSSGTVIMSALNSSNGARLVVSSANGTLSAGDSVLSAVALRESINGTTGTGNLVFGSSPTISGGTFSTATFTS